MWSYDASRISAKASLALGHANCFGPTFDWRGAGFAAVLALLPDGSEQAVTAAPLLLDPP